MPTVTLERLGHDVARSPLASLAVIVIVSLLCFLPGLYSAAPVDGDEPGYVVAAREMVATRDYATVRLQSENAEWRPRGAYWVQALVASMTGGAPPIWVHRLPSLAGAIIAALLAWWLAIGLSSSLTALLTGLFVAASGVVGLEARLATPDALHLAATTLMAGTLARVWRPREGQNDDLIAGLFWTSLGVAILLEGWIAPAMAVSAIAILSIERGSFRWLMTLRPASGLAWLFLIISPWLISLSLAALQGTGDGPSPDYLRQIGVAFQLRAPPGSYALLLPLLAGPLATFIFVAVPWIATEMRRPAVFFALAWGGPLWLAAELITQKEPQAILPAIPAVAILAAAAIDAGAARIGGRISWFYSLGPLLWPPLVAILVPVVYFRLTGQFPWDAFAAFFVAAVLGPVTWLLLRGGTVVASALVSVATVVFIYLGFFGWFVPGLSTLRVGERLAALAPHVVTCSPAAFATAGYPEESLVLALGPDTRLVDAWSAADFLNTAGCRVAAVESGQISAFRQRAEDLGLPVLDRGEVRGFDLRKMRAANIHLFVAGAGG